MTIVRVVLAMILVLAGGGRAAAQGFEVTVFVGRAFPTYDERLIFRPSTPTMPGVDVTVDGSPLIEATRRAGARRRYRVRVGHVRHRRPSRRNRRESRSHRRPVNLLGTEPPFEGLTAHVTVSAGTFDADRIGLVSTNVRIRTPGRVALVVSGGLSYLPDINVTGSLPVRVEVPGAPPQPDFNPTLTLRAVPGQSEDRWGANGGAGLRIGGRVALMGEVRVFYFRDYELQFDAQNGPPILDQLLDSLAPVHFDPIFVNVQAGVTFRF